MIARNVFALAAGIAMVACAQETSAPAAPVIADPAEVAARVAAADAAMGRRQYIFCQACHTTNPGGQNKVGPNLSGIVGQSAGQVDGFVYSAALSASGLIWDLPALDSWLDNPNALVPGTTMIFGGVRDPAQRANLIAYLQQVTASQATD
jgi:cytochrome c